MASGRSDYWYGMLPGKSSLGIGQTDWVQRGIKTIAGGESEQIINYTVPANYKLHVCGFIVSCDIMGLSKFDIVKTGMDAEIIYFDTSFISSMDSGGIWEVSAGGKVVLSGFNYDSVSGFYNAILYGFLEYQIG